MSASKLQFQLAHLFYAVSMVAAATSLFGVAGLPLAAFVLLIWWQVIEGAKRESHSTGSTTTECKSTSLEPTASVARTRSGKARLEFVAGGLLIVLTVGILLPAPNEADPMQQTTSSMRQVALALLNYETKHHAFPPPVIRDSDGRPMHSWRAAILEELGEPGLAAAYRWDEPWDGPNNSRLLDYRPWHFRPHGCQLSCQSDQTVLQLLPVSPPDQDETSKSYSPVVVEQQATPTAWLEPNEFDAAQWRDDYSVPDRSTGYWYDAFLASIYCGSLAATSTQTFRLHSMENFSNEELLHFLIQHPEPRQATSSTPSEAGESHFVLHYRKIFLLAVFLAVALYPLKWLQQIRFLGDR